MLGVILAFFMRYEMKQVLYINWCEKYNCPGGDCGLTCCTSDWKIRLSDKEIENYKKLDHPFRDELISAIDMENKVMICDGGKCNLLDENGYCKLVINCGPEALSRTCNVFPWWDRNYGFIREAVVEIVCPLVAEFLFEVEQPYYVSDEVDEDEIGVPEDANTYLALFQARNVLMDIFSLCPQQYIYGKYFILFKCYDRITKLIKDNIFNTENVNSVLNDYCNENKIGTLFEQCNLLGEKIEIKETIMFQTFCELTSMSVSHAALLHVGRHKKYIMERLNKYINSEEAFREALYNYINYAKEQFPMLAENFMVYSLICSFVTNEKEKFGHDFVGRIIEMLYIQLIGMAILEEKGTIDKKEFSVAIAALDRVISHDAKMFEILYDYYEKKQAENDIYFMMLLA